MGTPLGSVNLRFNHGWLALEQRGDGIEFTLTWLDDGKVGQREVFKVCDDQVSKLASILGDYVADLRETTDQ